MTCLTGMQCRSLNLLMYIDGYAVRHMLGEEVRVWNIKTLVPLFDLGWRCPPGHSGSAAPDAGHLLL